METQGKDGHENEPRDQGKQLTIGSRKLTQWAVVCLGSTSEVVLVMTCEPPRR